MSRPAIFERHPDTEAVIRVLRSVNDFISYEDLAQHANVTFDRMKQVLYSARKVIRARDKALFGAEVGVGLRRLTDPDIVLKPEQFKKRTARGARREVQDLSMIGDFGGLSKADQHSVTINRTILGAIQKQASVKTKPQRTSPQPMADTSRLSRPRITTRGEARKTDPKPVPDTSKLVPRASGAD